MKKHLTSILFIVVLIVVSILVIKHYYQKPTLTTTKRYATLSYSNFVKQITFPGTVVPVRQAKIVAPYSGYIKKLYVTIGEKVQKGDPIVSIIESLQGNEKVYPMRAPYSGTVVSVHYAEGEFVRKGDTRDPVAKIDDLSAFYVSADVTELDVLKIKKGQKAEIKVLSIPHKTYSGMVSSIFMSPKSKRDGYSRSHAGYPIKVKIENHDNLLKPGMSAIVNITLEDKKSALTLPHEFVLKKDSKSYVILKNGTKVPVSIGAQTGNMIVIKNGVKAGTVVQQVNYFKDKGNH